MARALFLVFSLGRAALGADSSVWFKEYGESILRLSTSAAISTGAERYGTAFAVRDDGTFATNYHVIAQAINRPASAKLFIEQKGQRFEAQVLAFDVAHDVALVRAKALVKKFLPLGSVIPEQGTRLFSMGFPVGLPLAIVEATGNGLVEHFPYQMLHFTGALNHGMSGGPVLDMEGRVVALNDAVDPNAQSVSFGIPVKFLTALLNAMPPGKAAPEGHQLQTIVERQLFALQDAIAARSDARDQPPLILGRWKIQRPSPDLTCSSGQDTDRNAHYSLLTQHCRLEGMAYLDSGLVTGTYLIAYSLATSTAEMGVAQMSFWLEHKYNSLSSQASNWIVSLFNLENEVLSKYACHRERIKNDRGVPFAVNYCLRTYLTFGKLYDVEFKAISHGQSHEAIMLNGTLRGFSEENAWRLLSRALNGLETRTL